ncbi:SufE family protein [Ancylobacter dichloromethanicus]|uniref:Cysteine desulfurization protein SufE n=1 Tax=Ancylobacter dichloromethanicus TaxID=518825 RepID=A0A9W6N1J0_9HYPH|nr:SufE family protein [Ancylobacter dichloromethanicus]MBS7552504.1 SufE family protein [Ancylobacter dichloromethanicus]GLK74246.1 cysteine desulfurization protein SufE [Ancylobacter dichloromethanicus]
MTSKIDSIIEDFELLDNWDDRYRYLIELGRALPPFPEERRTEQAKVQGCASQVWLVSETKQGENGPRLALLGDSDAHIVRGLVAILLALYSDRPARDILATDPGAVFARIGLKDHLTPQRSNGLRSMVERIRGEARKALADTAA